VRERHPERFSRDVGRRIAELRREQGKTQEEIAEALGLAVRNLQRIERGMNFKLHSLLRIAVVLDVPVTSLLAEPASTGTRARAKSRR
jgi:transcriptional regulator with XRE-family HTH domain